MNRQSATDHHNGTTVLASSTARTAPAGVHRQSTTLFWPNWLMMSVARLKQRNNERVHKSVLAKLERRRARLQSYDQPAPPLAGPEGTFDSILTHRGQSSYLIAEPLLLQKLPILLPSERRANQKLHGLAHTDIVKRQTLLPQILEAKKEPIIEMEEKQRFPSPVQANRLPSLPVTQPFYFVKPGEKLPAKDQTGTITIPTATTTTTTTSATTATPTSTTPGDKGSGDHPRDPRTRVFLSYSKRNIAPTAPAHRSLSPAIQQFSYESTAPSWEQDVEINREYVWETDPFDKTPQEMRAPRSSPIAFETPTDLDARPKGIHPIERILRIRASMKNYRPAARLDTIFQAPVKKTSYRLKSLSYPQDSNADNHSHHSDPMNFYNDSEKKSRLVVKIPIFLQEDDEY